MLAEDRLLDIEAIAAALIERLVPLELDGETLRVVLYWADGSNLRVAEQWAGDRLVRYSYYWLAADNALRIGWDNAPHHTHMETFPHHKHVAQQSALDPSAETRLEDVLAVIRSYAD